MRTLSLLALAGSALLLTACGSGGGEGGNTSRVTGADRNRMVEACLQSTNNERPMCECVADLGRGELTPLSFHLVLASLESNHVRVAQLRGELSPQEAVEAGGFTVNAFARCARSMSGG